VEGAGVQDEPEAGADAGRSNPRRVAVDEPHVDIGRSRPFSCALHGLAGDVDADQLPAALRQVDAPDPTATAEVERRSIGGLAFTLSRSSNSDSFSANGG
jgi:hypothetical protein